MENRRMPVFSLRATRISFEETREKRSENNSGGDTRFEPIASNYTVKLKTRSY